jgi:hypothetical protein
MAPLALAIRSLGFFEHRSVIDGAQQQEAANEFVRSSATTPVSG